MAWWQIQTWHIWPEMVGNSSAGRRSLCGVSRKVRQKASKRDNQRMLSLRSRRRFRKTWKRVCEILDGHGRHTWLSAVHSSTSDEGQKLQHMQINKAELSSTRLSTSRSVFPSPTLCKLRQYTRPLRLEKIVFTEWNKFRFAEFGLSDFSSALRRRAVASNEQSQEAQEAGCKRGRFRHKTERRIR